MAELRWDPQFEMGEESGVIARKVWPPYLAEDSDLPQPGLTFEVDLAEFQRRFPAWGLRDSETGRLLGYLNAVLLAYDVDVPGLPEEGWQFAIEAAARGGTPNTMCLVVANVDPGEQRRGLATLLLEKAKQEARRLGLACVIAPVRPSRRHEKPGLSFEEYVLLRRDDGLPWDPWLRAHARAGAEQRNICPRSAVVTASVAKWTAWTGQDYPRSGSYPLEGGLAPLTVDLGTGVGTYVEPNVWFRYRL
jgi:GNAT superfamily N-acetyltransferase